MWNFCLIDNSGEKPKPSAVSAPLGGGVSSDHIVPIYLNGRDGEPVWVHRDELLTACGVASSQSPSLPQSTQTVSQQQVDSNTQTSMVKGAVCRPPPRKKVAVGIVSEEAVSVPDKSDSSASSPECSRRKKPKKPKAQKKKRSRSRKRYVSSSSSEDEDVCDNQLSCVGGPKAEKKLLKGDSGISTHPSFVFVDPEELNIERQAINRRIAVRNLNNFHNCRGRIFKYLCRFSCGTSVLRSFLNFNRISWDYINIKGRDVKQIIAMGWLFFIFILIFYLVLCIPVWILIY